MQTPTQGNHQPAAVKTGGEAQHFCNFEARVSPLEHYPSFSLLVLVLKTRYFYSLHYRPLMESPNASLFLCSYIIVLPRMINRRETKGSWLSTSAQNEQTSIKSLCAQKEEWRLRGQRIYQTL